MALVNSARSGYYRDASDLGRKYYFGRDVPQDYGKARAWLEKAADQGDQDAQFLLGVMYRDGKGVPQDYVQARVWFQEAADQGDSFSQNQLGHLYEKGLGGPIDNVQACKWLELALMKPNVTIYKSGGVDNDDVIAKTLTAAQAAEVKTQVEMWKPLPPTKDQLVQAALEVLDRQNYDEAVHLLTPLANDGHPVAEVFLAGLYHTGDGVPRDDVTAFEWAEKSANQGNATGEFFLGSLYYSGQGTRQDYAEAAKWLRKAADQGVGFAQYGLGVHYLTGHGVNQNDANGAAWLQRSAEQGNASAQSLLSSLYAAGKGVPKDDNQAYKWAYLATIYSADENAKKQATDQLGKIGKLMGVSQIEDAKALAKSWKPNFPGPEGQ